MTNIAIKVLVIEDNLDDVELIKAYLRPERDVTIHLDNVDRLENGLNWLHQHAVDVVLLDLGLPDSTGLDTFRQVVQYAPHVPVVVMTGAEVMGPALEAVREGAADYLFKNRLDGPLLVRTLRFAIERAGRLQATARQQEAEIRYRTLFEQSPDGIVLLDPESLTAVEFNDVACRQLGFTRDEFSQLCLCDYDPGQTQSQHRVRIAKNLRAGPTRNERLHRMKSGQMRHVVVTCQPVRISTQTLLYCVYRDITVRKRAEIRLRESEERFRSLVETTSDWIWVVDADAMFTYTSPKVRDLLGYEPAELIGTSLFELVASEEVQRFAELVHEGMASTSPLVRLEHTNRHKDGRHVVLETSAMPAMDSQGQLVAYRGIDRDITEVKEAQDSLRERELRYRQLLAAVTSYTYTVHVQDGHPAWTAHGEGCVSVTGYCPEDYANDPNLWISMVHPDDQETIRQQAERILTGEDVLPIEHRIRHRDGRSCWVRSTVVLHRENGRLVCYDGLIEDITERKRTERALRQQELQLLAAQKIQERLLPNKSPTLAGFDIAGALYPAEFAAGDYYDYLPMRGGEIACVIGDVSGHGFAPALIMASTHVMLRLLSTSHEDIGEILALANSVLEKETEDGRFVTLIMGSLNPVKRTFTYANAGHPPALVIGRSGDLKAELKSTGMPLGILASADYMVADPVELDPGDTLILVTDGILESRKTNTDLFGQDRVLEIVRRNRDRPAAEIARQLCFAARDFSGRKSPSDDTTAVVIKVEP